MNVLVCGSRDYEDRQVIEQALTLLYMDRVVPHKGTALTIITGMARGADSLAAEIGHMFQADKKWAVLVKPFPADWKRYGRGAGPIRNQQMLDEGKPNIVLAFHDHLEHSKGTRDMITRARKAGVPVMIFGK